LDLGRSKEALRDQDSRLMRQYRAFTAYRQA